METKTITEQFPWAVEGAEAYIYQFSGWGVPECRKVTVEKVTKARITVTGGRVFYTRKYGTNLRELGKDWYHSPELIAADDPRVESAKVALRQANSRVRVLKNMEEFKIYQTVDGAKKTVEALLDFIEASKGETE